jgi:2-polyprenyl-3-methyl-5-hydroxy-6-metoxy-1,4-benzoquinol methylase
MSAKIHERSAEALTGVLENDAATRAVHTVNCNFCGSADCALYDRSQGWSIVKCKQCGLRFTNPRPTAESLASFYTLRYFKDEDRKRFDFYSGDGASYLGSEIECNKKIADVECHVRRRGSLFEIGAATGAFLRVMQMRGWKVSGVEISRDAVEAAKEHEGVNLFCGSLEEFETEEKFDAVCMYQSLEHVPDPAYAIKRAYELLSPGGIMVVEVPNVKAFDMKWSKQRKLSSYDLPLHLTHFEPAVLEKKLEATGFKIIDVDLYYPQFLLSAVSFLNRIRANASSKNGSGKLDEADPASLGEKSLPLMQPEKRSWKAAMLKSISRLFPGWRFTIIARKPAAQKTGSAARLDRQMS